MNLNGPGIYLWTAPSGARYVGEGANLLQRCAGERVAFAHGNRQRDNRGGKLTRVVGRLFEEEWERSGFPNGLCTWACEVLEAGPHLADKRTRRARERDYIDRLAPELNVRGRQLSPPSA